MDKKLQPRIDPKTLGRAITQRRKEMGLTLAQISSFTGVDKGQVSKFCSGKFKRPSKNLQKVCKYLQIDLASSAVGDACDLQRVLAEVKLGWKLSDERREQFVEAIMALVQLVK